MEGENATEMLTDSLGPALWCSIYGSHFLGVHVSWEAHFQRELWPRAYLDYFDLSNVGHARPGVTSKVIRLGMTFYNDCRCL